MGIKSKGEVASADGTGVAKEFADIGVGDEECSGSQSDGVDGNIGCAIRYVFEDALDDGCKAENRAEDWIASAALGTGIHFDAILLVLKGYCDKLGSSQGRVRV